MAVTACSLLELIRLTISSEYKSTALRAAAEVSASRSAIEWPWKRIASTACSPLALMRATTSSERCGAARRARSLRESIGDRVAMEANRRGGLFAACADAGDDIIGILVDRAARC